MSTILRGFKTYVKDLTAVVAVSDNGGHSGLLRKELNILPPGDIRNCILALAETEPEMEALFQYRFKEGSLKGHNLGNLFLAALTDVFGGFEEAVDKANQVLRVKGQVVPVTLEDIQLIGTHKDGTVTEGEHEIVQVSKIERNPILNVKLKPENPRAYDKAIKSIEAADNIIIGPGSLFTSIIPNLMVSGVTEAISRSKATVYYVANMMTQPGETDDYTLQDHLDKIESYLGKGSVDVVVVNNEPIDPYYLDHYEEDGASQVIMDVKKSYKLMEGNLLLINKEAEYIRHDPDRVARLILQIKKD